MIRNFLEELQNPWVLFGFGAQFLFFLRFFVQWVASERRGKSYIPVVFWWFSLGGGSMLFVYACQRADPVFIAGQGLGCLIYIRNLVLIYRRQRRRQIRKRSAMEVLMSDGLTNGQEAPSQESVAAATPAAEPPIAEDRPVPAKPERSRAHAAH